MNKAPDAISQAMPDALIDGPGDGPAALFDLLSDIADPIDALSDHDRETALFDAFHRDLPFLRLAQHSKNPLSPAEHQRLVRLLRWIITEYRGWRRNGDPLGRTLVALFVASQACDWENGLWDKLPAYIGHNSELVNQLKLLISSLGVKFSSRDSARTPIWEREAIEALESAEARNDWAGIADAWQPFSHLMFPNVVHIQAARCLYHCGIAHLADALANLRQTAGGMMIASALPTTQALTLAVASDNGYVRFCCLNQVLTDRMHPATALSVGDEQLITKLLLRVMGDTQLWAAWMKIFNSYPLRYPGLQKALGVALADGPDSAIESYINSIVVYPKQDPQDAGRAEVAACLGAFRAKASPARRSALWTAAHTRWSAWDFNRAEKGQYLFSINGCELDYAIVGFACECLDSNGRNAAVTQIVEQLQQLEHEWFESVSDAVTAWNRLLSRYQPYAHAEHAVPAGEDWLATTNKILPFDPNADRYVVARFQRP